MPYYDVRFARTTHLTVHIEADHPDEALELAPEEVPEFTAREAGWGSFGTWSAGADDWQTLDEFYKPYSVKKHGKVVEEAK